VSPPTPKPGAVNRHPANIGDDGDGGGSIYSSNPDNTRGDSKRVYGNNIRNRDHSTTTVIAGFVVPRSTAEADAEVLGFGFCRNQSKQPEGCRNQKKISFHSCNWQTKAFAHGLAELLEQEHPDQVVSRMQKVLRNGKVLIDWSQNDDHKTTINVYSLRAKAQPTVSTAGHVAGGGSCREKKRPKSLILR
jgi:hypothetical protein